MVPGDMGDKVGHVLPVTRNSGRRGIPVGDTEIHPLTVNGRGNLADTSPSTWQQRAYALLVAHPESDHFADPNSAIEALGLSRHNAARTRRRLGEGTAELCQDVAERAGGGVVIRNRTRADILRGQTRQTETVVEQRGADGELLGTTTTTKRAEASASDRLRAARDLDEATGETARRQVAVEAGRSVIDSLIRRLRSNS